MQDMTDLLSSLYYRKDTLDPDQAFSFFQKFKIARNKTKFYRCVVCLFIFIFLLNEHNLSSEAQMVHPKVKAVVFVGTLREFPEESPSEND